MIHYNFFREASWMEMSEVARAWLHDIPNRFPRDVMQEAREILWRLRPENPRGEWPALMNTLRMRRTAMKRAHLFMAGLDEAGLNKDLIDRRKLEFEAIHHAGRVLKDLEDFRKSPSFDRIEIVHKAWALFGKPLVQLHDEIIYEVTENSSGARALKLVTLSLPKLPPKNGTVTGRVSSKESPVEEKPKESTEVKQAHLLDGHHRQKAMAQRDPVWTRLWHVLQGKSCPICGIKMAFGLWALVRPSLTGYADQYVVLSCLGCATEEEVKLVEKYGLANNWIKDFQDALEIQRPRQPAPPKYQRAWVDCWDDYLFCKCGQKVQGGDVALIDYGLPAPNRAIGCKHCSVQEHAAAHRLYLLERKHRQQREREAVDELKKTKTALKKVKVPHRIRWMTAAYRSTCMSCNRTLMPGNQILHDNGLPVGQRVRACEYCSPEEAKNGIIPASTG